MSIQYTAYTECFVDTFWPRLGIHRDYIGINFSFSWLWEIKFLSPSRKSKIAINKTALVNGMDCETICCAPLTRALFML